MTSSHLRFVWLTSYFIYLLTSFLLRSLHFWFRDLKASSTGKSNYSSLYPTLIGIGECSLVSILSSPLFGLLDGTVLVTLPVISDSLIKWIIAIWCRHQGLDWEQHSLDLKSWGPLVLEDIEADTSELVYIWMVNLSSEEKNLDFWSTFL